MIRSILKQQRGGAAILNSLGFLLFSIPLISGSLGLAQATTIDARVKTDIMHRDYCGLAVQEYFGYMLMDMARWQNWLDANQDSNDPDAYNESLDLCGEGITISVVLLPPDLTEDPIGDDLITIPFVAAYNQRDFQTSKIVSNSNPGGGDPVVYTIKVVNRSDDATILNEIRDTLPPGLSMFAPLRTNWSCPERILKTSSPATATAVPPAAM